MGFCWGLKSDQGVFPETLQALGQQTCQQIEGTEDQGRTWTGGGRPPGMAADLLPSNPAPQVRSFKLN